MNSKWVTPESNDPNVLKKWKDFLQKDARSEGGTATIIVRHMGELLRITACSKVVITEPITDFEATIFHALICSE